MSHDAKNRQLVERACVEFERDLKAYFRAMLLDVHLADDVYQRTVVRAIEASASVRPETVRGWLFQIGLNEIREVKRQSARYSKLQQTVHERSGQKLDLHDGLNQAITEEEKLAVLEAMKRLSPEYHEVVDRRIRKGQTFAVIAEEMEKPLGTVLTWMRRALMELSEMTELRRLTDHQ